LLKRDTISDYEIEIAYFGWAERTQSTEAMEGALSSGVREPVAHLYHKEPVVVSGRELSRLEAKIQVVRDDLHAARLKVRSLLKKTTGKTVNNMRKKQQARIVGRNNGASKSGSPFVTPNAWLELSKTEKECARALYVLIPQSSLRKRCLGIMDVLEKICDGYLLMQLMKMEVLASAKFSPATILYKARLNFPPTGIFTADLFLDGHLQQRVQLQFGLEAHRVGPGTRCSGVFRGPGPGCSVVSSGVFRGCSGVHQSPSKQPLPGVVSPSAPPGDMRWCVLRQNELLRLAPKKAC
jgi:hypothetical protein